LLILFGNCKGGRKLLLVFSFKASPTTLDSSSKLIIVVDCMSGRRFLVNIGAVVKHDSNILLTANGTPIPTYGRQ